MAYYASIPVRLVKTYDGNQLKKNAVAKREAFSSLWHRRFGRIRRRRPSALVASAIDSTVRFYTEENVLILNQRLARYQNHNGNRRAAAVDGHARYASVDVFIGRCACFLVGVRVPSIVDAKLRHARRQRCAIVGKIGRCRPETRHGAD
jgi:hypothetical protein